MYHTTNPMQKVQPLKDLFGNLLAKIHWQAFIVVSFNNFKKVAAKDLKDHAKMVAVMGFMDKSI